MFMSVLFLNQNKISAQTETPFAETIKGITVNSCDSINTIIIFFKNPACHACYEIIGEFLSNFLPAKNIGITYWIDESSDRYTRRQASDYLKSLVTLPGKFVFTPLNLSEKEKKINNSFDLPVYKKVRHYPIIMLLNKINGYKAIYNSNDILSGSLMLVINENFEQSFKNFLEGNYEKLSRKKKPSKRKFLL